MQDNLLQRQVKLLSGGILTGTGVACVVACVIPVVTDHDMK